MSFVPLVTWMIPVALIAPLGCSTAPMTTGTGAGGTATGGSSGSGAGGTTTVDTCGECAPGSPADWSNPFLVWIGAEKDAPECPTGAPALAYEGHADPNAPLDCGTCSCTSPTGTCSLPVMMTANAATCALNSGSMPKTPFDPSSAWTGACNTNDSIPSGALCSGVDCVQSLTIAPLTVKDTGGCSPSQPPMQSPPVWQTFARACQAVPRFGCEGGAGICLALPPRGFRVCIYQKGDNDCPVPVDAYTDKHVFYDSLQDTRACSRCTCGVASGSTCSSTVSIYTDGACSTPAYSATVDAMGPVCHDLPPGTPLGSKSATTPTYTPGSCQPDGGQPMGAATPTGAATLCCIPVQ
jgi:hypothetical protein